MKSKISVVKSISLLLITMALAVAMTACEEATPAPEDPAPPIRQAGIPPSVYEELDDVALAASGAKATLALDLDHHFYDPDGKDGEKLSYEASSSDSGTVKASLDESTLTLKAVAVGTAKIFVKATDKDDLFRPAQFDATVVQTAAPQITTNILDQELAVADGVLTIYLPKHFAHERAITYAAISDSPEIVNAAVEEKTLTLAPLAAGQAIVVVTATADDLSVDDHFIVTVKANSEPTPDPPDTPDDPPDTPPTPADAPEKVGTIPAQEVEVGASSTALDVSRYFSPTTGLTYTAVSSDTTKATTTIPTGSSTLTITGVAAGTAIVTVTATASDDRTATQPISVTVVPAGAPYKPSTVSISGVNMTKDVSIDEGQTLRSFQQSIVTATPKSDSATVWTLTGKTKGTTEVRIRNKDQTLDKTISVTVENTPPKVKDGAPNLVIYPSDGTTAGTGVHVYVDEDGNVTNADNNVQADETANDGKRLYHRLKIDFAKYFEDADGSGLTDIGKDGYKAKSNEPYIKVVGQPDSTGVVIDVTKPVEHNFSLAIYVMDKSGAMSERVTLSIDSPTPLADRYEVSQDQVAGAFGNAKVYQREGVSHTLTFATVDSTPDGFRFVYEFQTAHSASLAGDGDSPFSTSGAGLNVYQVGDTPLEPFPPPDVKADATPNNYYVVTKTGSLDEVTLTMPRKVPTLMFEVTGDTDPEVTITYYRLVDPGGGSAVKWEPDSKTLTMNIGSSS